MAGRESPQQGALSWTRCAFLLVSLKSCPVRSPLTSPLQRAFYVAFGVLGALWLLSFPVAVLLGYALPTWARERVVLAVSASLNTAAIAILAFLLWPSRAARAPSRCLPEHWLTHRSEYFKIAPPEIFDGHSGPRMPSSNTYTEL